MEKHDNKTHQLVPIFGMLYLSEFSTDFNNSKSFGKDFPSSTIWSFFQVAYSKISNRKLKVKNAIDWSWKVSLTVPLWSFCGIVVWKHDGNYLHNSAVILAVENVIDNINRFIVSVRNLSGNLIILWRYHHTDSTQKKQWKHACPSSWLERTRCSILLWNLKPTIYRRHMKLLYVSFWCWVGWRVSYLVITNDWTNVQSPTKSSFTEVR